MRTSRRFALHSTKKSILYLYNTGDENTAVTGGLVGYAYKPSWGSSTPVTPTVTKNADNIVFYVSGASSPSASLFTENAVSLTGYRTMHIKVKSISGSDCNVGVTATKANGYSVAANTLINGSGEFSVDISSLNGNYYPFVECHGNGNKSISFTEWWLSL